MSDVRVDFTTNRGQISQQIPPEYFRDGAIVETMSLSVNGLVIVRIPFYLHDGGVLHTICNRDSDAIKAVTW